MTLIILAVVAILYLVIGMIIGVKVLGLREGTALLVLGIILAAIVCVVFTTPLRADAAVLSQPSQQSTSSLDNDETAVEEEGEVVERHELIPSPVTGEYLEKKEYERYGGSSDIYFYYYLADDGKTVVQGKLWWSSTTIRVGKEDSKAECVKYVRHEKFLWGLINRAIPHYTVTIPPKD